MNSELNKIQKSINDYKEKNPDESVGELSDTYHSFNDLYEHCTMLLALLLMRLPYAWKSKVHEDGTMFDGMFIAGVPTPDGMISYHCDLEYWNLFKIPSIPKAPHFDGYTEKDVLNRLESFIKNSDTNLMNPNNVDRIETLVKDLILPVFGDNLIEQAAYIAFYNA